jgi:hypothetical protein
LLEREADDAAKGAKTV